MKTRQRIPIQRRLIGFLLFVSLVPLAAMGCYGIFVVRRNMVFLEKYKLNAALSLNVVLAKNLLSRAQDDLTILSNSFDLSDAFEQNAGEEQLKSPLEKGAKKLNDFLNRYEGRTKFARVSLVNDSGREFFRMEKGAKKKWSPDFTPGDLAGEPAFKCVKSSERFEESPGAFTATSIEGKPCIAYLIPVYSRTGAFRGVILALLDEDYIKRSFVKVERNEAVKLLQEEIYLVNQDGAIIFSSMPKGRQNIRELFPGETLGPLFALDNREIFDRENLIYLHDTIIPGRPISRDATRKDYLIVIERTSMKKLMAASNFYMHLLQILLGAFTILSVLAGVYLSKNFLYPIRRIISGTEEVRKGNLNYALSLDTGDEFEDLANHFNSMVTELKTIYSSIEQKVVERTRDLEEANLLLSRTKEIVDEEKDRLEGVLNSTKEGIIMINPAGGLVFANRSFYEIFAFCAGGESWNIRELLARKEIFQEPEKYLGELESLTEKPEEVHSGQMTMVLPSLRIIDWFSAPIKEDKGRNLGRIIAFRDITREKEVERMKDEFVSIVSHELRTPMTSLSGSLSLVLDGTVGEINEDQKDLLEIAKNNTTRLIRLINDILDISKIEAGKIKMKQETVKMENIITDSMAGVKSFADSYQAVVKSEIPAGLPEITADHDRLIQVVTNLLSNAIKFSPPNGTVLTRAWVDEEKMYVSVKDEGSGIPPEHHEKIFEKFQQVDSSSSRAKGGTGLGLPICRAIIQELSGRLWLESEPGKGATFIFYLPLGKNGDS